MLTLPDFAQVLPVLTRPLRLVPHGLQRPPLELALGQLFGSAVDAGGLDFLECRCLAIEIEDTDWRWPVTRLGGRLKVLERDHAADVTIRGQSPAFVALAARLEDPDTLFFQRRLVIEGDTELGLGVKNFLDGFDEEQLPRIVRLALQGARDVAARLDRSR